MPHYAIVICYCEHQLGNKVVKCTKGNKDLLAEQLIVVCCVVQRLRVQFLLFVKLLFYQTCPARFWGFWV